MMLSWLKRQVMRRRWWRGFWHAVGRLAARAAGTQDLVGRPANTIATAPSALAAALDEVLERQKWACGGAIHLINLERLQQKYGDDWPRVAAKVESTAHLVLQRRLTPADMYARFDGPVFLIVFATVGPLEAEIKSALIAAEIERRLLGIEPGLTGIGAVSATARLGAQVDTRPLALTQLAQAILAGATPPKAPLAVPPGDARVAEGGTVSAGWVTIQSAGAAADGHQGGANAWRPVGAPAAAAPAMVEDAHAALPTHRWRPVDAPDGGPPPRTVEDLPPPPPISPLWRPLAGTPVGRDPSGGAPAPAAVPTESDSARLNLRSEGGPASPPWRPLAGTPAGRQLSGREPIPAAAATEADTAWVDLGAEGGPVLSPHWLPAAGEIAELPLAAVEFVYRPVWAVGQQSVAWYRCRGRPREALTAAAAGAIDTAVMEQTAHQLHRMQTSPFKLGFAVHYDTLAHPARRDAYFEAAAAALPAWMRGHLVCELVDSPSGVAPLRLNEIADRLRPFVGVLLLRLRPDCGEAAAAVSANIDAVGLAFDPRWMAEPTLPATLERFTGRARKHRLHSYLYDASTWDLAAAIGAGFDYVDDVDVVELPTTR